MIQLSSYLSAAQFSAGNKSSFFSLLNNSIHSERSSTEQCVSQHHLSYLPCQHLLYRWWTCLSTSTKKKICICLNLLFISSSFYSSSPPFLYSLVCLLSIWEFFLWLHMWSFTYSSNLLYYGVVSSVFFSLNFFLNGLLDTLFLIYNTLI